ncbi:MAG: DUF4292 domain-containing protein [Bdellovibrionia bacterium]
MFVAALLAACGTPPYRFDQDNSGRWKARTLIKDLVKQKSHILYAEILAQKPQNLRVDVTTSLGIHLARMTLNEEQLSYILTREKKFFSGPATPAALKPVMGMALDPKLLVSVLFETQPTEEGWDCKRDKDDLLQTCTSEKGVELSWTERSKERRTITVKSDKGHLQLELSGYQSNVQVPAESFAIKAPPGFKSVAPIE